jgi:hypothetical protein
VFKLQAIAAFSISLAVGTTLASTAGAQTPAVEDTTADESNAAIETTSAPAATAAEGAPEPVTSSNASAADSTAGVSEATAPQEPKPDELVDQALVADTSAAQGEKVHRYAFGRSSYAPEKVKTPSLPANAQIFVKNHGHVYGIKGWSSELGFTVGSMVGQAVGSVLFDGSGAPSSVGIGYQIARPGYFIAGNRDIRFSLSLPTLRMMGYYWWKETGGIVSLQSALVGATLTGDRGFKWYVNFSPVGASAWLAVTPDLEPVYSVAMDFTTEVGIWW